MNFGSICSGIEAASVAFAPLGWTAAWLAEIETFPSAVLAHHYPDTPNLGDMTTIAARIDTGEVEAPDALWGGTPCQAFSVAGLRRSLDDARGNLSLEFIRIADAIDRVRRRDGKPAAWIGWENVPGVLSTKDNAFGAFLGGLCGCDTALDAPADGWPSAGVVAGPGRVVAWRVLDAQFFGVAQRRKRVFVLALGGSGAWACADALLPVSDRMRWHPAPRREAGKAAPTIPSRSTAGGGLGTDFDCDGGLIVPTETLCVATGQAGAEIGAEIGADMAPTLNCNHEAPYIAHSLRGEGFDASEDGTGRGTPLVPVPFDTTQITSAVNRSNPQPGDACHPLAAGAHAPAIAFTATDYQSGAFEQAEQAAPLTTSADRSRAAPIVAFSAKDHGGDASEDCSPTLRAGGHAGSHANAGVMPAVAYTTKLHNTASNNAGKIFRERAPCMDANSPPPALLTPMQVRRLTPVECARLQGFPDDYLNVTYRGKPAADGPKYRALGNSWAVPCARWIGQRIATVRNHMEEA